MWQLLNRVYYKHQVTRDCVNATLVPHDWEFNTEVPGNKTRVERVLKSLYLLGQEATKDEGGVWEGVSVSQGRDAEIVVVSHSKLISDMEDSYC